MSATYTVRRIVQSQGVERIFLLHSPFVQKVEVKRTGKIRRSRLYFLRDRKGKKTRLKEIIGGRGDRGAKPAKKAAPAPTPEPEPEAEPEAAASTEE